MKGYYKHIILLGILLFCVHIYGLNNGVMAFSKNSEKPLAPDDTIPPSRYPISKTTNQEYQDLTKHSPADLRDPDNLNTTIEYDLHTGMYIIRTKVGDMELETPITLTPEEYQDYSMQESMRAYYRQKNEENFRNEAGGRFNLTDMQFNLGPADKIFGPGGVRIKSQGSAEIGMGLKSTSTKNPSLPEGSRSRTSFNFDTNVQMNMNASVGTKVNFGLNYNTQSSFDFDATRLKLAYTGEEDEIIKTLEAGNVTLNTGNSLIRGGAALFGIKTGLQFGKLRVNALLAQQESESQTISTKGGAQTKKFELSIDQYDDNRHFFLNYYFRDQYDQAMSKIPLAGGGININRIEVWVTNKRGNYNQARNIVAFSDLGEHEKEHIHNDAQVQPSGTVRVPYNEANTLYKTLVNEYPGAREISTVTQSLNGFIEGGVDYQDIASARRLEYSEYIFNKQLGYISLQTQLQQDEVLAVAYEYTYNGKVYQVGEFSTDNTENTNSCLFVKLLKGVRMSPSMPFWDLMMKNVYSLNAYSIQKDRFRLDILYQSDTIGTYVNYLPEGDIANQILLRAMNLDRLDANNEPHPDGFYDFVEGLTVQSASGRIIFPVVEPFGSHLRKVIGNNAIANKYVFQELYDSTKTVAQQIAEKNKFILRGEYRASSSSEILLGATNVARGSVVVTAGGVTLTENVDYTVDYVSGSVTILNQNVISSNSAIRVSLENRAVFNMQRKTMMGLDLNYEFSKNFNMGATIMHLSEMPVTTKTAFGDESIRNTLWGANMSYNGESQWLTNLVDKIPLLDLTQPSRINFNAEFAHLIAGHYESKYTGKYSYLDDFESTQSNFDLLNTYPWALASVPYQDSANALFPEASLINKIDYGKNRALFAWYYIDGLFTRPNSSLRPRYMDNNLSNHYMRAVDYDEIFPKKDLLYNENSKLYVLNLAYYPNERGPYNLDATNINPNGTLINPEKRWGGMMRKIDQSDFELANIEYIEFWMMDPFIYNRETTSGGDLYFNLGDISEDILKDEKKFFENGLPVSGDMSQVDTTVWGKVPRQQSMTDAFDNTAGVRKLQDVGFNGLSSEEELKFPTYINYLDQLEKKLSPEVVTQMKNDPLGLSPFKNPSGDKYHYFRGQDYDNAQLNILERYKRYNGTEGNSTTSEDSPEKYDVSAKSHPDVEDINQDKSLSKGENYYEYKISLRPNDMTEVGRNYITNIRTKKIKLPDNTDSEVTWYQFKIPIKENPRRVGRIQDFKTIRFMRVYMTDFNEPTFLRFGTFSLVRGDWRAYTQNLARPNVLPSNGRLDVTSINIEEDGDRQPINYILPPGVSRIPDASQTQIVEQNEQALSMTVTNLGSRDARAIYKTTNYDLRRYKRLQLFVHAEKSILDETDLNNNDLSVFMRLGTDYKNNYYEYEVPLSLTPFNKYNDRKPEDREIVWPESNMINFKTELLTNLKTRRNRAKREGQAGVNFQTEYSDYDPEKPQNRISVVGNPSLAEVKTIMIGIRNNSNELKTGIVWINELRLSDFDEQGGWAASGNLNIALSDLGTINASGRIETAGFGGLDQSINERNLDDYTQYAIASSIQLGKFFPEKARVSLPLYYAFSRETTAPKYNPLDQDILLKDALDNAGSKSEKDSIKSFSQDQTTIKSLALNNIRVDIRSKNPMPYDPSNFTMSYAYSESKRTNPETTYETTQNYQGNLGYNYTPYTKPFIPFGKLKKSNGYTRYIKQLSFNYLPSNIYFQTSMLRNYYELQLRNLDDLNTEIKPSFSQQFYWDRGFGIRWSPLNNLNLEFSSNTHARIEEGHLQVNKKLNYDDYQMWKDSVKKSIADLGTPLAYDQTLNVTYNIPFQYIPVLDWANGSLTYNAIYNWERGAYIDTDVEIGNTIKNQRQLNFQVGVNLQSLYNKNKFLKKVNQKFSSAVETNRRFRDNTKKQKIKYEGTIELSPDSGVIVTHGLLSKKLHIRARKEADSSIYRVQFKVLDFARIRILNKDSIKIKVTLYPGPPPTEDFLYKAAEYSSRFLMMVRRINVQYSLSDGMMLPGFLPSIGDWIGQANTPFGSAPGWGFALGDVRESYVVDAVNNNWMITQRDDNGFEGSIMPAMINRSKTFTASTTLEPAVGFKIDLNASRVDSRDTEIQFMFPNMPTTYGGSFTMTTVALGSMFSSIGNVKNGYASKTFDKFLQNRDIITSRTENKYIGKVDYPNTGFMEGNPLGGNPYNPSNGAVRANSSDVLIPAFLAAYTGKNANRIELTAFPAISSLLPNWKISYDGLIQLPIVKKHFKSMVLNHQYRCVYSVGSYDSYLNWVNVGNDLGFVQDITSGNPFPASAYEISSVSITEGFNPLIGMDATFLNNVTVGAKFQKTRNLNLNMASYQIIETFSNDITLSLGYKYADFNKVLKMRGKGDFSNDLTVRLDFSNRKNQSLIRKIEDGYTQMTQGASIKNIQLSADYAFSKSVTLRAFYDLQINQPLVSSTSFPTSNSNYGLSIRLSLTQ